MDVWISVLLLLLYMCCKIVQYVSYFLNKVEFKKEMTQERWERPWLDAAVCFFSGGSVAPSDLNSFISDGTTKDKQLMSVSRRRRLIFISRRTHTRLKTRENKIPMLWFILILDTAVQVTHSPETAGQQRYCTCSAPVQLLHFMSWTLRICLFLHV